MTPDVPLLELRNVSKTFRRRTVLTGINLALGAGRNVLVTGPSGSGKSTLLRLACGLDSPSGGEVFVNGRVAFDGRTIRIPPHERGIAMVFQDLGLWPNLTAMENVLLGLSGVKLPRRERKVRARAMLVACHIDAKTGEFPHRLSAGEQQRVALARALAVQPRLLLLDEPFTGLDIVLRESLLVQIVEVSHQFHTSILLVSHQPSDATALGAQVVVLEGATIAEQGDFEQLLQEPCSQTMTAWKHSLPPIRSLGNLSGRGLPKAPASGEAEAAEHTRPMEPVEPTGPGLPSHECAYATCAPCPEGTAETR